MGNSRRQFDSAFAYRRWKMSLQPKSAAVVYLIAASTQEAQQLGRGKAPFCFPVAGETGKAVPVQRCNRVVSASLLAHQGFPPTRRGRWQIARYRRAEAKPCFTRRPVNRRLLYCSGLVSGGENQIQ